MSDNLSQPPIDVKRMCLWMLRYPLRRKLALSAVFATMLLGSGLRVLSPWPMKVIVDNVVETKPLPPTIASWIADLPLADSRQGLLGWCVAATVLLFVAGWAVGLAGAYASIIFGQRMIYDLAADLFGHLQRLSLRFHGSKSVGDLIRRVTNDCGCVSVIIKDAMLPVLSSAITLVAMFAIMWDLSWALALLSLGVVPLMLLAFKMFADPMLQRSYVQEEADAKVYGIVEQALASIPVVKAFGAEDRNDASLRAGTGAALSAALSATRIQLAFKVAVGLATALGTAGIIGIGSRQVLTGDLTLGGLLMVLAYLGMLYAPLHALIYTGSTVQSAAGSAWRVIEILETDHEVIDAPHAAAMPRVRGDLRFESVTFGYDADRAVLQKIDLHVPAGGTVALVGPSGAGKSTLASMVPRFFDPWEGRVILDGRDIREVKLKSLRQQVAVVLQEPFLFPLTVAQNIAYGIPHASREQIELAARAAGADQFIRALPDGYDTSLGERGATLSGGERQRVSIARALLKDAPVLILDEPTASLDAATEAGMLEAMRTLMRGRTTLVIAHRLSTIRSADQIVSIDRGQIVEQGTHDELIAAHGLYARLYRLQMEETP